MPQPVDLAREPAFQLSAVHVRPATREVVGSAGLREILEPRVMQVLVALARRRGEVVSRDELIDACWRGRVVGDDAVSRCIAALRRLATLCGGLAIETIPRVGYRLDEACGGSAPGDCAKPDVLVAVLPFETLSDDAEMTWFSDGVSEEIFQAVRRGTALKVLGRAASFQFRGPRKVVSQVAAEFRATHVLDGSVRRHERRVRVCAHLIECQGQTTLWSQRFERELADIFALQDAIADVVTDALREALQAERRPAA
jgi:TolB-like protein/DNA-binding winged helix-turn-helix (wHTH) protein